MAETDPVLARARLYEAQATCGGQFPLGNADLAAFARSERARFAEELDVAFDEDADAPELHSAVRRAVQNWLRRRAQRERERG